MPDYNKTINMLINQGLMAPDEITVAGKLSRAKTPIHKNTLAPAVSAARGKELILAFCPDKIIIYAIEKDTAQYTGVMSTLAAADMIKVKTGLNRLDIGMGEQGKFAKYSFVLKKSFNGFAQKESVAAAKQTVKKYFL